MFKTTKNTFRWLLFIALAIAVVGCSSDTNETASGGEEDGEPVQGGEVVIGYETDVSNYDPIKGNSGGDHVSLWPVFDTLIKFTPELEEEAGLAESWEFEDDTTLILTLREGLTFHDGTPVDAEAVKFNLERVNSEDSNVSDLQSIESVEATDEITVTIKLSKPDSSIVLALSDRGGMMVSPTAIKEAGEDFSQNPVGAGPFKMVKHVPNGEIVLEAFEDYWQEGQPHLDRMIIKIMQDENTRINALKSGEIDFADNIKPGNVQSLENDANIVLKERTSVQSRIIFLNTAMEPTDNKAVRQAMMYGVDRENIIQAINFGSGEPAYQPFPLEYWAADENMKIEHDPEKAKKILQDARLDDVTITLNHYSTAYEQRLAEAIKSQLGEIGINVNLKAMELTAAVSNYFDEKESQALLASWTGRPDPQMTINNLFGEKSFYNVGHHSTDELSELISDAASEYEQDGREGLYSEISKEGILEEAIYIPLFFESRTAAMNQSIKGFEPNLLGKSLYSTIWKKQ